MRLAPDGISVEHAGSSRRSMRRRLRVHADQRKGRLVIRQGEVWPHPGGGAKFFLCVFSVHTPCHASFPFGVVLRWVWLVGASSWFVHQVECVVFVKRRIALLALCYGTVEVHPLPERLQFFPRFSTFNLSSVFLTPVSDAPFCLPCRAAHAMMLDGTCFSFPFSYHCTLGDSMGLSIAHVFLQDPTRNFSHFLEERTRNFVICCRTQLAVSPFFPASDTQFSILCRTQYGIFPFF